MNATHQYMFSKRKLDVCISFTDKYGIIKTINFLNDVVCLRWIFSFSYFRILLVVFVVVDNSFVVSFPCREWINHSLFLFPAESFITSYLYLNLTQQREQD